VLVFFALVENRRNRFVEREQKVIIWRRGVYVQKGCSFGSEGARVVLQLLKKKELVCICTSCAD
jgi:hypothetical protein